MHVKAKTMAFGGLLLALTVVCMALGSIIETSTLFLLAAASFFVGIVVREFGLKAGAAFHCAEQVLCPDFRGDGILYMGDRGGVPLP